MGLGACKVRGLGRGVQGGDLGFWVQGGGGFRFWRFAVITSGGFGASCLMFAFKTFRWKGARCKGCPLLEDASLRLPSSFTWWVGWP